MNKIIKVILINILVVTCFLGMVELFLFVTLSYPEIHKILPSVVNKITRRVYFHGDMNTVTYMPECAKFDSSLGYTLRPGKCVFSCREFTTPYFINSLGVRDTEEALNSPQIVVVGDSYAMGWGVQQNETFAKIIESKTGMSVLNAAVASYGTAREMILLQKVKRDRLKYLIIQYCDNDYEENLSFLNSGNKLITMKEDTYERLVRSQGAKKDYYLGKFILCAAYVIKTNFNYIFKVGDYKTFQANRYNLQKDEVEVFLNVLLNSGMDLTNVQLLVFKANSFDPGESNFVISLKKKIAAGQYPPFIKNMIIMDAGRYLNENTDIFYLNLHYNQRGNQVIAGMIMEHLATK